MQNYNLNSLVRTLHAWRKPLLFFILGVAILSAVISLLLPVYYRASTVFYAASQDLFKPQKVFGYTQTDMYYYGGTEDIERILTTATSQQVTGHLIETFDLYGHYNIKRDAPRSEYKVRQKLLDHYAVIRTKYDALEINVEDRDPELAARIANGARDKINSAITGVIKGSQQTLINSYREAISAKEVALRAIQDSLHKFQKEFGIYDPEAQAEFLSTLVTSVDASLAKERAMLQSYKANRGLPGARDSIGRLTASIAGLERQFNLLTGADTTTTSKYAFDKFAEGKGRVELYGDAYEKAVNTLNLDREMLKQMEAAVALDVTAVHLIEEASPPVVKHRPKRSLLVFASTFAAFIFMLFGILIIESVKDQDWSFLRW